MKNSRHKNVCVQLVLTNLRLVVFKMYCYYFFSFPRFLASDDKERSRS